MIGTFEDFHVTHGSFGEQFTKINGQICVTYWDAGDRNLRVIGAGATEEFEAKPVPTLLCSSPPQRYDSSTGIPVPAR